MGNEQHFNNRVERQRNIQYHQNFRGSIRPCTNGFHPAHFYSLTISPIYDNKVNNIKKRHMNLANVITTYVLLSNEQNVSKIIKRKQNAC